ncbi:8515_t:CDS:2 [Ambispora gerdemannii]|uniref:8515_t:CDS:1 n=1 Tax=Ambispora gerdemannii TaxID=144530 RepID=A0A9N8Z6A1_9GLOM|nr:8515_t:CDS:2 [Ambispora gerdemannii]
MVCLLTFMSSIRNQQHFSSSLESSNSPANITPSASYVRSDNHYHHNRLRRQTSNVDVFPNECQAPTDAYIDAMLADSTSGHSINFATFLTMMANKLAAIDSEGELLKAFSNLNDDDELNSGIINATKLRQILATQGEQLTDEEGMDDSENFDYGEFVKTLKHGHMDRE